MLSPNATKGWGTVKKISNRLLTINIYHDRRHRLWSMDAWAIYQTLYPAISPLIPPPDIYRKLESDSISTDTLDKGSDEEKDRPTECVCTVAFSLSTNGHRTENSAWTH